MQLPTALAEMLKSGRIIVLRDNVEALEIKAADKRIQVTALDKKFVKDALSAVQDGAERKGSIGRSVGLLRNARGSLGMLKEVAEDLSSAGITITLSYKGGRVVTLGSEADPMLSMFATGTRAIEVNNVLKLLELGI